MANTEIVERLELIMEQIIPENEIDFREVFLRMYSGINDEIDNVKNNGVPSNTKNIVEIG